MPCVHQAGHGTPGGRRGRACMYRQARQRRLRWTGRPVALPNRRRRFAHQLGRWLGTPGRWL